MKILQEFQTQDYRNSFYQFSKNRQSLQNTMIAMNKGDPVAFNRESVIALIDFYNEYYLEDRKIEYKK
jgi:hypothetical protein